MTTIMFQILAHEIGHQLGMEHDFVAENGERKYIRYDRAQRACTSIEVN